MLKWIVFLVTVLLYPANILFAQALDDGYAGNPHISNQIEITMPARGLRQLQVLREKKEIFKNAEMAVNGEKIVLESLSLRGQSSLGFHRKSLNVKLSEKTTFLKGGEKYAMKEFYLIGMTMDQYYYRSYLSYTCLQSIGLFPLFFAYTELFINGETQGIYMVVEKPHESMKKQDSPCVIRRGYGHKIEEVKFSAKKTDLPEHAFTDAYAQLYELPEKFSGKELYKAWNKWLDVDAYMRWLAFNFFIMNGDYADELYLYAKPVRDSVAFGVIPWDYDDILVGNPHRKDLVIFHKGWKNKYMFMAEEKIDQVIAEDEWLHQRYLEILGEVLDEFSSEKMKEIYQTVFTELAPFYRSPETVALSRYDEDGQIKAEDFPVDFSASYDFLVQRRNWLQINLENK
ncbi:MAG: CotH kinase family protein [Bacteroidia bacterium]|nr:CotH kinase family protein [Bacteroidia bacterium]